MKILRPNSSKADSIRDLACTIAFGALAVACVGSVVMLFSSVQGVGRQAKDAGLSTPDRAIVVSIDKPIGPGKPQGAAPETNVASAGSPESRPDGAG